VREKNDLQTIAEPSRTVVKGEEDKRNRSNKNKRRANRIEEKSKKLKIEEAALIETKVEAKLCSCEFVNEKFEKCFANSKWVVDRFGEDRKHKHQFQCCRSSKCYV